MDTVDGIKTWLLNQPEGVVILEDASPDMIHFTIDHNVVSEKAFVHELYKYQLWVIAKSPVNKVKERKVANYEPSW